MAETREQRQQRFLQRDLDRQAREQQIKQKLPTLGAQAGWMGGLMAPSSGLTDYFGLYPQIPTQENMIPTERMPSFSENIENKRYMDALYQTMGVLGDAAYASTPFTGPAGLIAGTTLKGVGAAGKASKSKGIASLSEQADLVNKYARDEDFVSPTIETLINRAPKDLKGKQITEWVNASANKGVKPKELQYLGIDEFIEANPNASIDEVVRGVSDNQIKIRKNVISGDDSPVLEFLESTPDTDPLDGSNFWQYRADDYLYDIEKSDSEIQKELLDHYNEAWDVNFKSWDEVPETMHEEIADSLAKQEYRENPYEMIEVADAGPNTFALGNEDTGYSIFVDGKGIDTGDVPYSNTEARIQLRDAMSREGYDFGRIDGEEDIYSDIQYKSYIDNNLPGGENYREVVFNWENAPEDAVSQLRQSINPHFDDENQIAHALVRDRTLEDGSKSLHIDELQSDLHREGSRHGYKTKKDIKEFNKESSNFLSKMEDAYAELRPVVSKYRIMVTPPDVLFKLNIPDQNILGQPQVVYDLQEKYKKEDKKKAEEDKNKVRAENLSDEVLEKLPNPSGWRILVLPFEPKDKTKGGIIIAQESLDKLRIATNCGYVIKVGPLAYKDEEKFYTGPWCKKGDWVIFARYAGSRLPIEGGEVRLLNDDEVLGTINNPEDILHHI